MTRNPPKHPTIQKDNTANRLHASPISKTTTSVQVKWENNLSRGTLLAQQLGHKVIATHTTAGTSARGDDSTSREEPLEPRGTIDLRATTLARRACWKA